MSERETRMARELSEEQVALLICAVEQFADLIGDSQGVAGLHLNGDIAEWDWLRGDWLNAFDDAYAPIKALHDVEMDRLERLKNARWSAIAKATGAA